jgi:hypothetical protein
MPGEEASLRGPYPTGNVTASVGAPTNSPAVALSRTRRSAPRCDSSQPDMAVQLGGTARDFVMPWSCRMMRPLG